MLSILFITYEYSRSTFSGNGVHAISQVRGLKALGHSVTVVAACPSQSAASAQSDEGTMWVRYLCSAQACLYRLSRSQRRARLHRVVQWTHDDAAAFWITAWCVTNMLFDSLYGLAVQVEVPQERWGVLNGDCAWEAFSTGATSTIRQIVTEGPAGAAASARNFHVVLCVDWHAALVWRELSQAGSPLQATPWAFLNYRMFSRDDTAAAVRHLISLLLFRSPFNSLRVPFRSFPLVTGACIVTRLCRSGTRASTWPAWVKVNASSFQQPASSVFPCRS